MDHLPIIQSEATSTRKATRLPEKKELTGLRLNKYCFTQFLLRHAPDLLSAVSGETPIPEFDNQDWVEENLATDRTSYEAGMKGLQVKV